MMQASQTAVSRKKPIRRAPQRTRSPDETEIEISKIVGRNIRTLRTVQKMSQTTLADSLGITFQQVQKYESGMNRVSAPKLVMMAEIFNVPITAFFSNTGLSASQDNMPIFGKQGIRGAKIIDDLPPHKQGAAVRVLQLMVNGDEE